MKDFNELRLCAPLLEALSAEGYVTPTPIQAQAIPHLLEGKDLLGIAQTGTGKTAAFALPILQRLADNRRQAAPKTCRVLILSPTRELAGQIAQSFRTYGRNLRLTSTVVFGGVGMVPQIKGLARGVDILVATPGRLMDHMRQGTVRLDAVECFVLDEADRMLDMGFINDVRRMVRVLPKVRQNLFFSATMPREIAGLAAELLTDPVRVAVTPEASTVERVVQHVIFVDAPKKRSALTQVLADPAITRAMVFTRTKRGADRVTRHLQDAHIEAAAIHGDKSQGQRERALSDFRAGKARVLVATDIAARGIDVDGVSHVINYELPNVPESYVHRIGRTARAGAEGVAISLCDREERAYLRDIEKTIRQRIPIMDGGAEIAASAEVIHSPASTEREERRGRDHRRDGGHRHHGGGGRGYNGQGRNKPRHGGHEGGHEHRHGQHAAAETRQPASAAGPEEGRRPHVHGQGHPKGPRSEHGEGRNHRHGQGTGEGRGRPHGHGPDGGKPGKNGGKSRHFGPKNRPSHRNENGVSSSSDRERGDDLSKVVFLQPRRPETQGFPGGYRRRRAAGDR
ncbi:MAG: DEAD/DEAH box helicase [Alphaproteobacteria bacterium]